MTSSPGIWATLMAQLGLVLALSFLAPRHAGPVAGLLFLGYAALTGMTFRALLRLHGGLHRPGVLHDRGVFGAMSIYGTVTKKDLSGWGTFLFMGLIGVVIAGVVNSSS